MAKVHPAGHFIPESTCTRRIPRHYRRSRDIYDVYTPFTLWDIKYDHILHSHLVCTAAAVGTVQVRSLIEPLRKIIARLRGQMICGKAVDLAISDRLLEAEILDASGHPQRIYIPFVFHDPRMF